MDIGDVHDQLTDYEEALAICSARVDAIIWWIEDQERSLSSDKKATIMDLYHQLRQE